MSDIFQGPELFPIAIGRYADEQYQNLEVEVEAEVAAVAAALADFDVHLVDWDVEMARGAYAVNERLTAWSDAHHPQTILYWVGHGWSNNQDAILAHHDSPKTADEEGITPGRLAKALVTHSTAQSDEGWRIVVIDACNSKRFIELLETAISKRPPIGLCLLIGGLSGEGATELGKFSHELKHLVTVTCSTDLEITLHSLAHYFYLRGATVGGDPLDDTVVLRRRNAVLVNSPLDVRRDLDAALAQLTGDELRHFLPKAHGGEMPLQATTLGEQSWYFEGRTTETQQIVRWITHTDHGLHVVTGPAGSGKSALLGHLVVHANPTLRTALHRAGLLGVLPPAEQPPDGAFDLVLHLTGAPADEVLDRIATGISAGVPPTREITPATRWLADRLRGRDTGVTILVDALDEAVEPLVVARALRELAAVPRVRILVGTRSSTREAPDRPAPDQDLLDALGVGTEQHQTWLVRDAGAVHRYVSRRLQAAGQAGVLAPAMDIDAFSEAVRRCDPQFLFARLVVHEVLADPHRYHDPRTWGELLYGNHRQLFGRAVDRLAAAQPSYRPLLAALAYARGRGLPDADDLWLLVAQALAPDQDITHPDIGNLTEAAAPYVLADREHDQTVYRLAHRTFAEYFTNESEPTEANRDTHLAIMQALITVATEWTRGPGTRPLNPYLTQLLSAHAASAGEPGWRVLDEHRHVLALLEPERVAADALRAAFGHFPLPPAVGGVLTSCEWLHGLSPNDRRLGVELATAHHLGTYAPGASDPEPGSRVTLRWAALRPRPAHRILTGHTGRVRAVEAVPLSGNRTLLASAGDDGTVRLWDPATGSPHGEPLTDHTGPVSAVAAVPLSGGRTLLATIGDDGRVRLWNPDTGQQHKNPLTDHTGPVSAVAAVPLSGGRTLLATIGDDGRVRLWNPDTGQQHRKPLTGHTGPLLAVLAVAAVPLSGGRTLLAFAGDDGRVRLWNPDTGRRHKKPLTGHTGPVSAVAAVPLSGGRTLLASAGDDGTVRLWNPDTGRRHKKPLTDHTGPVSAVATVPLSGNRTLLASAGDDGTVRLWNPDTGSPHGEPLTGHTGPVSAVAAVPLSDGRTLLASAGDDGTVRLWDPATGSPHSEPLTGYSGGRVSAVVSVPLSGGRTLLATIGDDGTVRLWNPHTGRRHSEPSAVHTDRATTAPLPDGRVLIAGHGDHGTVRLCDSTSSRRHSKPLNVHTGGVEAVVVVPLPGARPTLASVGNDGTVLLWDRTTGTSYGEPQIVQADPAVKESLPSGRVALGDRSLGRNRSVILRTGGVEGAVVTLPNGRRLFATVDDDGMVRLWDLTSSLGRNRPVNFRTGGVEPVVTLPDGRVLLASADNDNDRTVVLLLWDPTRGRRHSKPLIVHTGGVEAVVSVPLPGGRILPASVGNDGTVLLWDPTTGTAHGQPLICQADEATAVTAVALPDGRILLANANADAADDDDRTVVLLWDPITTWQNSERLNLHTDEVEAVVAVPLTDKRILLAILNIDGTVRVWDPASGSLLSESLTGYRGPVSAVAEVLLPDGRTLLADPGNDGTVLLRDPESGSPYRKAWSAVPLGASVFSVAGLKDGLLGLGLDEGVAVIRIAGD
ncbi:hypothetical protein EEB14_20865 [Rhodococcus sp. WS4]|nr:hypothetical protein EEB14_20865 [Rhodococcus sp. WS4]